MLTPLSPGLFRLSFNGTPHSLGYYSWIYSCFSKCFSSSTKTAMQLCSYISCRQQNVRLSLCETTQVREYFPCRMPATAAVWYTLKVYVHALHTGCVLFGISRSKNKTSLYVILIRLLFNLIFFSLLRSLLKSGCWWYKTTPPHLWQHAVLG